MRKIIFALSLTLALAGAAGCGNDSDPQESHTPSPAPPARQWSETLKGDGEKVGAYPDLYCNYWEYTYRQDETPGRVICLKGQYPYCRYFSLTLYNDETGTAIKGLDDTDIRPDAGSENPFTKTLAGKNFFTVYIAPAGTPKGVLDKLEREGTVCQVDAGVKRVAVCLRQYLGTKADGTTRDEYGGVALPQITALDATTLAPAAVPERAVSNIEKATSQVFTQKSDDRKIMPFFLAPNGRYYPNYSTNYLYARTLVRKDSVLFFRFIPATAPSKPEEYATAHARYWSVCLGSGSDTRSYLSLCDRNALFTPGEPADFAVCLKSNPRLSDISEKVKQLNARGGRVNLFVWDSEKRNIDGKPLGEIVVVMYRNILPNKDWEYSISRMKPTAYKDATGEPIDHVTEPEAQLAHLALKAYGPLGVKYSAAEFLSPSFDPDWRPAARP